MGSTLAPGVLVCFALGIEARPFRVWARRRPAVQVLLTGMGPANARSAVQPVLQTGKLRGVFSCGFAGALNPAIKTGAILFEADDGFPFLSQLRKAGAQSGTFSGAVRILASATAKRTAWQSTGCDAVEMESWVIRPLCRDRGVPSATLRIISDAAHEDLPVDFNALMTPDLRLNYARLAWALARSPRILGSLVRLQRRTRAASKALAQCLAEILG